MQSEHVILLLSAA